MNNLPEDFQFARRSLQDVDLYSSREFFFTANPERPSVVYERPPENSWNEYGRNLFEYNQIDSLLNSHIRSTDFYSQLIDGVYSTSTLKHREVTTTEISPLEPKMPLL